MSAGAPQEPVNPGAYRPTGEPYGTPPPTGPSGGPYGPNGPNGPYGGPYGPSGAPPPTGGTYAYTAPPGRPVPAGLGTIWQKWLNVTTRPSVASFSQELPTANWRDIWITLIGLGVLSAITGAISSLYTTQTYTIPQANGTTTVIRIPAGVSWLTVITVPLAFFVGVAILYVVAKIFRGRGTFLEQSYAQALYYVPIQGVIAILGLLPILGGLAALVLGIYEIVLSVFAIAASHKLTVGTSVIVVLLPAIIVLFVICALAVLFAAILAATLGGSQSP